MRDLVEFLLSLRGTLLNSSCSTRSLLDLIHDDAVDANDVKSASQSRDTLQDALAAAAAASASAFAPAGAGDATSTSASTAEKPKKKVTDLSILFVPIDIDDVKLRLSRVLLTGDIWLGPAVIRGAKTPDVIASSNNESPTRTKKPSRQNSIHYGSSTMGATSSGGSNPNLPTAEEQEAAAQSELLEEVLISRWNQLLNHWRTAVDAQRSANN